MTKKHSAILDALETMEEGVVPKGRAPKQFLRRSTRVAERLSGEIEEKTLRWIDPAQARMWDRHNRAYDLLTEDNCRDLIDGIRSQGRQEFPAIARETGDPAMPYEVICGARRHFAISWLRANNYPQFKYLIELRSLTDEEAFRLADIENRDREDLSDYERALDYWDALNRYYEGSQKDMAARLEMSPAYLSRFLQLAKLPSEIVEAFASIRDIRELHARTLKKPMSDPKVEAAILAEGEAIRKEGRGLEAAAVMKRLLAVTSKPKPKRQASWSYTREDGEPAVKVRRAGPKVIMEFPNKLSDASLRHAVEAWLSERED